ncbi:unnamed protein product [Cuscuta campestris]|uniref:Uncharacterized protein n=2 Tax=Cuscuta sect. Cleistogrammica TaxID=1824901 RepID=A0A484N8K9_9ASTE|nr:hypothetical protein DM860_007887 [Cuscuta australis]VFQ97403.1 unnamed protein product [Cuscuta campestris]
MGGFPWKKAKGTARISQMVKDQFRRRKTAASPLLVQTGFPTSLVDLILKNHERFNKPSGPPIRKPPPPSGTDDPDFSPPSPPVSPPRIPISSTDMDGSDNPAINSNWALSALLKIFMLVVLALGTKKFAAGITLSAFFLFFLDYLARNVFQFQILATFRRIITSQVVRDDEKDHPIEEIQIVEDVPFKETDDPSLVGKEFESEGTQFTAEMIGEDDGSCELSQSKRRKSRRAKIRSKMKKLFPSRKGIRKGPKAESNPTGEAELKDTFHDIPHSHEGEVETTLVIIKQNVVERKGNYGYMVLVMVALLGLVMGGKIYALTFTLTWCFLSKWTVFQKRSLHLYS